MAWTTTLVEQLRYYIDDLDSSNYTWTNEQLQKYLALAAIQVSAELSKWGVSYTVDFDVPSIEPDPSNTPEGSLIVARAACLLARGEYKSASATAGWKIVDDKSTIDGRYTIEALGDIADSYCEYYNNLVDQYQAGNLADPRFILSPYVSANDATYNTVYRDVVT